MSVLGGRGAARDDALPLAGCGTSKDAGCIAIRGKCHRAVARYAGAPFEFRRGRPVAAGEQSAKGAYRLGKSAAQTRACPQRHGLVTQRPVNDSGWARRAGLKIGSQESPP